MIATLMRGVLFATGLVAVSTALFLRRRLNQGRPKASASGVCPIASREWVFMAFLLSIVV